MPVKGVLLDLAGVVYQGGHAIPGALQAIDELRSKKLPIRFVTNTTRSTKHQIHQRLVALGLNIESDEIYSPVQAARQWLQTNKATPHLLVHPAIENEFAGLETGPAKAVIIGDAGRSFTYDTLNLAFRALSDEAQLLALAKNRTFNDDDGDLSLDAGPFVAALEYASGKQATVLGKPSPQFFHAALESIDCAPDEAVMVGDDADADVSGARAAGIANAILVRTGKYRSGDEARFEHEPTETAADLSEAAKWILANCD